MTPDDFNIFVKECSDLGEVKSSEKKSKLASIQKMVSLSLNKFKENHLKWKFP